MPFVKVRPRSFGGKPSRKAPFTVNVQKLRHAFQWLRVNNPYYRDVEWREDWAQEWGQDDVDIGTTRDEDFEDGDTIVVNKEAFDAWMQEVLRHRASGDDGFQMGGRLLELVESARDAEDEACDDWNRIRALAADALESPFCRCQNTLSRDILAAVLYNHEAIEMDGVTDISAKKLRGALRHWPSEELPVELCRLHSEMLMICEEMAKDVPPEHACALSSPEISDDVGHRGHVVQGASEAVLRKFGGGVPNDPEEEGPVLGRVHPESRREPSAAQTGSRPRQYPRVDAPEVEDAASMAIREDTPGYIAMAFPKLFPHGVGDFHDNRGGRTAPNSLLGFWTLH